MKRKISFILAISVITSLCLNINTLAFASKDSDVKKSDLNVSVTFVTDDYNETSIIDNIENIANNKVIIDENKVAKVGFGELGKKIKSKETKSSKIVTNSEDINSDTVLFNYDLLKQSSTVEYANKLLDSGKNVLFYGDNIDLVSFCSKFGLENCIPKDKSAEKGAKSTETENSASEKPVYSFVGVDKTEIGNVLVTCEDTEYNFYRVVDYMLKDALHSKEVKETKPYNDFKKDNLTISQPKSIISKLDDVLVNSVYAADVSSFPTVNYQRKSKAFNYNGSVNYWYLITDCYLHRDGAYSDDPTYDYFILETISELNWAYNTNPTSVAADKFYSKLTPYYSSDIVRDGGPKTQSSTTQIAVNLYPPSVAFYYTPGSNTSVSVSSNFSLSGNYFEATYSATGILTPWFVNTKTIHRTDLSFSNYAPSSNSTYVDISIYQKARSYSNYTWYWANNFVSYTYDY